MRDYPLVTPKFEREPDNAPGAFYLIKDVCILCALPPETAPDNITWDAEFQLGGCAGCPNHCRVERQPQTPDEVALIIEAMKGSCIEAIRYCGTDPEILAQFASRNWKDCVMRSDRIAYAVLFIFLSIILTLYCFPRVQNKLVQNRDRKTMAVLSNLAVAIEKVRTTNLSYPSNDAQLNNLLGGPLPNSPWGTKIEYKSGPGFFKLLTTSPYPMWTVFEYDSRNAPTGLVSYPF